MHDCSGKPKGLSRFPVILRFPTNLFRQLKAPFTLLLLAFLCHISTPGFTQSAQGRVTGKVIDSVSSTPLALASISIYGSSSQAPVGGNLTSDSGTFEINLPYGSYRAEIEFLGFKSFMSGTFSLSKENPDHGLGMIRLPVSKNLLDEVVVRAEKSSMELALDKRIFNVGKDLANVGGSASDILTNIPSVSVDPEGNVKLRGSSNVRILIDGKPSGLVSIAGGSGLQQLQASMVDKVEIITNPSARYEAEGMAGIINIVLKKDTRQGFNGSTEVITGYPVNLGAAANLNYRHKKINFFINYGLTYRRQPGQGTFYQERYAADTTFIFRQNSSSEIIGFNNNIRGGLDYYFTEKDILTASYLYSRSKGKRLTDILYKDYLFNTTSLTGTTTRNQDEDETEPKSEYTLTYKKTFERKGHELNATVKYIDNWENSYQVFTQQSFDAAGREEDAKSILQNSTNDEFEKHWLLQVDFVKPLGEEGNFEAGVRSSFRTMLNDYVVSQRDSLGNYTPLPGLDNVFVYDENIHAAYAILGNKHSKISYQAGLRAEWTDVKTTLRETKEENPRKYANLFPSAHVTYNLPHDNGIQVSYSRRVRRPFYNDLSPFFTFSDSRNFFSGNPDLNPEFSNVFELGHLKNFDKGSMASAIYYRETKGKIERIRRVNADGNATTRPENLISEKAFGAEFTSGYSLLPWWKLDLNFNFFHADIDGSNILPGYKTTTYSWFARQTSRIRLGGKIDLQLRTNYEAPQKTAQGERKKLFFADFSVSRDIFKGNGTLNLNVLDVLNSRKFRSVITGPDFYAEGNSQFRRRQVNLTFSYRIRQAKPPPKRAEAGEE